MEDIYSGLVVYLIGLSGVGKRTIAQEIAHITDMRIIDHLLIHDLLFKVVNRNDHVQHVQKSMKHILSVKEILLDVIIDMSRMQQSFILTDELIENNDSHKRMYAKVKSLAERRGSIFLPVVLYCSLPEIIRRFTSRDRSIELKSTDPMTAKKNYEKNSIMQIRHENLINIDISNYTAYESAKEILKRFEKFIK